MPSRTPLSSLRSSQNSSSRATPLAASVASGSSTTNCKPAANVLPNRIVSFRHSAMEPFGEQRGLAEGGRRSDYDQLADQSAEQMFEQAWADYQRQPRWWDVEFGCQ